MSFFFPSYIIKPIKISYSPLFLNRLAELHMNNIHKYKKNIKNSTNKISYIFLKKENMLVSNRKTELSPCFIDEKKKKKNEIKKKKKFFKNDQIPYVFALFAKPSFLSALNSFRAPGMGIFNIYPA